MASPTSGRATTRFPSSNGARAARTSPTAKVGVVTTTFPAVFTAPKKVYTQASSPVPDEMFTKDLSWDKDATHTNDVGTFLPLAALHTLAEEGAIGSVSERFYGVPHRVLATPYPCRRRTDCCWALEDDVDVMMLVPL